MRVLALNLLFPRHALHTAQGELKKAAKTLGTKGPRDGS